MTEKSAPMDERMRRIGQNETLYRQVNERIKDLNEGFSMITESFSVVCECGSVDCTEQIAVSQSSYEETRANSTRFLVKPGHEEPETERIVDRADDGTYLVVEKTPPEARRRAEVTDPRN